jgi:hypothetical protein
LRAYDQVTASSSGRFAWLKLPIKDALGYLALAFTGANQDRYKTAGLCESSRK